CQGFAASLRGSQAASLLSSAACRRRSSGYKETFGCKRSECFSASCRKEQAACAPQNSRQRRRGQRHSYNYNHYSLITSHKSPLTTPASAESGEAAVSGGASALAEASA